MLAVSGNNNNTIGKNREKNGKRPSKFVILALICCIVHIVMSTSSSSRFARHLNLNRAAHPISISSSNRALSLTGRSFHTHHFSLRPDQHQGTPSSSTVLYARRKKSSAADDEGLPPIPADWVTVSLSKDSAERIVKEDMKDRITQANRFVSEKMSDDTTALIERSLTREEEILKMLETPESMENPISISKSKKTRKELAGKVDKQSQLRKLQDLSTEASNEAKKIKGFLELNPYMCSGCGTPFQSKTMDAPGYLPRDKMKNHQTNAGVYISYVSVIYVLLCSLRNVLLILRGFVLVLLLNNLISVHHLMYISYVYILCIYLYIYMYIHTSFRCIYI